MHTNQTNRTIVWIMGLLAVVVNVAAYPWNLYDRLWWFDEAIHTYTLFAITLPTSLGLYGRTLTGAKRHWSLLILTITCLGIGIGGVWEIGEWIFDQLVPGNLIKGKQDTMIDLVMDTIGAFAAGVLCIRMQEEGSIQKN